MPPPRNKEPLDSSRAKARALRALGRREHSARELEAKLVAQGLEDQAAADLVGDLRKAGWQSDERYAELLVRSRISQGYGPLRIEAELSARGVAEALIRAAFDRQSCDWPDLAARVRERKFGAQLPKVLVDRQKQYRYLAGRGFDAEQIRAALGGEPLEE